MYIKYYFAGLFQFAFSILYIVAVVISVVKDSDYDFYDYIKHLTNHSWTQQYLYYTLTLPIFFHGLLRQVNESFGDKLFKCGLCCTAFCFIPLLSLIVTVFVGVMVLLNVNSTKPMWDMYLSKHDFAEVILGNDVVHTIPLISIVYHMWVAKELIALAHNYVLLELKWLSKSTFYTYLIIGAPLINLTVYGLVLLCLGENLFTVYMVNFSYPYLILGHMTISLIVSGTYLYYLDEEYELGKKTYWYSKLLQHPYTSVPKHFEETIISTMRRR